MLSKRSQHHHKFLKPSQLLDPFKTLTSGTLSPDTIATTSSGYSTGDSLILPSKVPSSITDSQHKTQSKGFHNFLTKLKNLISSPKTKFKHSRKLKQMPPTNILEEYSTLHELPTSSMTTSKTIILPFTYYPDLPIKTECHIKSNQKFSTSKATSFEKISAWLHGTEMVTPEEQTVDDLLFIDDIQEQSISLSPIEIDYQVIMKKSSSINKTPKRSTSMVTTLIRPIIESRHSGQTVSPASSLSSSMLTKGMSERMTPQKSHRQSRTNSTEDQSKILLSKSNRRRAIDFSRRRTIAGPMEQNNTNKENVSNNHQQQTYQFSPTRTTTSTSISTKKYCFPSKDLVKDEDILMNSYGLTILQQQRQSLSTIAKTSKLSNHSLINSSQRHFNRRLSTNLVQQQYISDSLEDLLCDREVESYFYPNRRQSPICHPQHIYINLQTPLNNYSLPSPPYIHGTLC